ncbi:MAG TPA: lysine--tRNA ligase [Patescibacteria group bacterium]|nr:lysine--tRNA ligase [Patescibacteria group bacterium]
MFWADKKAMEIIDSGKYKPYWVDDMKTPSGKIHVGSLRGVVIHDLIYKALKDRNVEVKYTYIFDDHDPMDDLPIYLPQEFEKYLGMPLFKIPSPEKGFENFAKYYALEFRNVFSAIDCQPEVLWSSEIYMSGKMNDVIKLCLDKAQVIRDIYAELYKKEIPSDWYPFQPYCPQCGKVSTTKVTDWDGEKISIECVVDKVKWTKGCGYKGEISPFSSKGNLVGKLPWKVEWPCKWSVLGITIEGAGKDHMSSGGSHDFAKLICERVLNYEVPYAIPYEFFLIEGKKMSSSKGLGSSAAEMLEILPPEILRFLMVKTRIERAIDFNPGGDTIPKLFDEYQEASKSKDPDMKRIFELSQVSKKEVPSTRFIELVQAIQAPNIKVEDKARDWIPYAKIWIDRFAPEEMKFSIKDAKVELTNAQKEYLIKVAGELDKEWTAEDLQTKLYEWAKEMKIPSQKAFAGIYLSLFGKSYGPKAAWVILKNKELIKRKFK